MPSVANLLGVGEVLPRLASEVPAVVAELAPVPANLLGIGELLPQVAHLPPAVAGELVSLPAQATPAPRGVALEFIFGAQDQSPAASNAEGEVSLTVGELVRAKVATAVAPAEPDAPTQTPNLISHPAVNPKLALTGDAEPHGLLTETSLLPSPTVTPRPGGDSQPLPALAADSSVSAIIRDVQLQAVLPARQAAALLLSADSLPEPSAQAASGARIGSAALEDESLRADRPTASSQLTIGRGGRTQADDEFFADVPPAGSAITSAVAEAMQASAVQVLGDEPQSAAPLPPLAELLAAGVPFELLLGDADLAALLGQLGRPDQQSASLLDGSPLGQWLAVAILATAAAEVTRRQLRRSARGQREVATDDADSLSWDLTLAGGQEPTRC